MNQAARIVSTLTLALVLAACGGREATTTTDGSAPAADSKPLTIKGSDTMVILGQRLAEQYMVKSPGVVVQVNGGGSGTGIAALINGTVDLAQSSRPMKDDEKQKAAQARGSEIVEQAVALDALAVFVNSASPVQQLTMAQVKDVFQGKVTNWNQIGGPDATIVLYGRENSSGTYDYFREHVLNKEDFTPRVQTLQGTAAVINAVGRDNNGIGYGGIAYAKDVRPVAISATGAAVAPSEATVADGTYPLSRKLFFYYPQNAPERVTSFVQWSLTPEAQALVTQVGYFPLNTTNGAPTSDTTGSTPAATATTSVQ
ncbi:MAG: phosphate ABC transporter substrate-binding protein [Acidobacteriota bacterium]|nr:phosphate ABC transporter substrate-binding protein [Acidobacteriota bacterium]